MTPNVFFTGGPEDWARYETPLRDALAAEGIAARVSPDCPDPAAVDYLVFLPGTVSDFTPFTRARAVLSLWAGVETITGNPTLTQPLARMVDDSLTEGMVEYVTGHVLRHHLGIDGFIGATRWEKAVPPLARDRRVTVLGLGELGSACATALAALRFDVAGWSRRPRRIAGITCLSGQEGLQQALERAEILVLLLPRTPETEDILNPQSIAALPPGAVVINPGRGALIDEAALLAALDDGHLGHATLDTFRTEPLPADHPFWQHPRVTVTPHIAAETRPETASRVIAANIRRAEAGAPLLYRVDRAAGY
ncbi:2-hydroxyacid dehydrogenase [Mangrovicoccus algicola]|uniref:Glyoxylate/hydroxypyruvate reductase A n=1 Tax=Mangrovicoccus algicola TaxID=2771008 RepID=A0A8J6YX05_9RHOB|nr:glyoxylate/hydroxypyruvate reductase A [Mangrovicoccus algicola]MBE3639157.1 glyoxylate/hydroxypyruvate reductase A [Mangrovicoccus algicola]